MPSFGPILVWLNAGLFFFYGLLFVVAPEVVATAITEGAPQTSAAKIDFRATYGGMTVAVGLLLAALARDPALHRVGLRGVLVLMLCMAGGRTIGIVTEGGPNVWMWLFLAGELAVAAAAFAILRAGPPEPS
ncbi:MAG: DUF4345 domain-containing protein [bacterium]|nr:DUF4345 domain-containing protein [bacterium]